MDRYVQRVLIGNGVSLAGTWFSYSAMSWLIVTQLKQDTFASAAIIMLGAVIGFFGAPLAPRLLRTTSLSLNTWLAIRNFWEAAALLAIAICVLFCPPAAQLTLMICTPVISGLLGIVSTPANNIFMRQLAGDPNDYYRLQVLLDRNYWLARSLVSAVAGAAIFYLGIALSLTIDALTYLFFAFILLSVPRQRVPAAKEGVPVTRAWSEWTCGFQAVWRVPRLRMVLGTFTIITLLTLINFFYAAEVISKQYGKNVWVYGVYLTLTGAAGWAGNVIVGRHERSSARGRRWFLMGTMVLIPALIVLAGYSETVWMFAAIQVAVSFVVSPFSTMARYELTKDRDLILESSTVLSFIRSGATPLGVIGCTWVMALLQVPANSAIVLFGAMSLALLAIWVLVYGRNGGYTTLFTEEKKG